jgi:xanthine/CO dehydrogenase XdhC/CoxF family maturation factor
MSDSAAAVSAVPGDAHGSADPACDVAHGHAEIPASTRTLVAVFASPVARFLLSYARDAGYRVVLVEPDAGRGLPGANGEAGAGRGTAVSGQAGAGRGAAVSGQAGAGRGTAVSGQAGANAEAGADGGAGPDGGAKGTPGSASPGLSGPDGLTTAASLAGLADEATDVVVTDHHRPELGPVLRDALASPARWVGVLGNPRHPAPHIPALAALGVPGDEIARVHRPIGLNIGSRTPAEIALATMAGLIADRNGRPGGFHF